MSRWIEEDQTVDQFISGSTFAQDIIMNIKKFIETGKGVNQNSYFNKMKTKFYISDSDEEPDSEFSSDDLEDDDPIIYNNPIVYDPEPRNTAPEIERKEVEDKRFVKIDDIKKLEDSSSESSDDEDKAPKKTNDKLKKTLENLLNF